MTKAADIMHPGAQWVPENETVLRAAQLMRELGVGALPVSDANERLCGIVTDRDIVIGCIAESADPAGTPVGALTKGTPRWIPADADVRDVLREMEEHKIRRLPVIDQNKRLVGMISEADLAHHLSDDLLGEFVEKVYAQ
ncbi:MULTISPECIES: CBS domain-containing protein [unclassified Streptomyces]|uniref:CBS domain-containing protein n=1 Tax=unclassified Streptomyces TaxID=2593676 RepID=UPI00168B69D4|nr:MULTISPECIES: CBS domain-containing protein [unclassified Streptomyces]MBD3008021.1 CBS domain-containing protein [Streptomyces sp. 5-10]